MRDPVTGNYWSGPNDENSPPSNNLHEDPSDIPSVEERNEPRPSPKRFVVIVNGVVDAEVQGFDRDDALENYARDVGFQSFQKLLSYWETECSQREWRCIQALFFLSREDGDTLSNKMSFKMMKTVAYEEYIKPHASSEPDIFVSLLNEHSGKMEDQTRLDVWLANHHEKVGT